jgi:hypothetical protein
LFVDALGAEWDIYCTHNPTQIGATAAESRLLR